MRKRNSEQPFEPQGPTEEHRGASDKMVQLRVSDTVREQPRQPGYAPQLQTLVIGFHESHAHRRSQIMAYSRAREQVPSSHLSTHPCHRRSNPSTSFRSDDSRRRAKV